MLTGTVFEYTLRRQCGCRVYFGNNCCIDAYTDRTAPQKGGEFETRWLKASTGHVTDSALGPR